MDYFTRYDIYPLSFNSKCIPFAEWISLLTLGLAPLIVHVASGSTSVSCLATRKPRWYDYVCHYNPTSILWRYATITDRRIRAQYWSNSDMATSNAIFWTEEGWDGREHMIEYAAPYCAHLPEHPHAELISSTMIKTVIAVAQGVGAFYPLVDSLTHDTYYGDNYVNMLGVDSVFTPVAIFGLLRLFAARWLTEDYIYTQRSDIQMNTLPSGPDNKTSSTEHLIASRPTSPMNVIARYRPTSYWPSRLFRTVYVLILLLFWGVNAVYIIPLNLAASTYRKALSVTMFTTATLYLYLLTITIILTLYYFARGRSTTTIIPCISSPLYRLYSYGFFLGSLALIVIASIETNHNPGGGYTSINWGNLTACDSFLYPLGIQGSNLMGVTGIIDPRYPHYHEPLFTSNISDVSYSTWEFKGYCSGHAV
ncbi:hypothetical protein E8E14_000343 [Neopestalotiopsis sp. 37M]|nr:hypothetical protein E8E14_000343 [Neopestalotiopsis sp. 37M]